MVIRDKPIFCDRQQETNKLVNYIKNQVNISLFSISRRAIFSKSSVSCSDIPTPILLTNLLTLPTF